MAIDLSGKIIGAEELVKIVVADKPLSDSKVGPEVLKASAKLEATTTARNLTFGFDFESNVSLHVFNSKDDISDGVVSLPQDNTPNDEGLVLTPPLQIDYSKEQAVVKTTLLANVSGNLSGSFSQVSVSIDASKKIELSKYNTHPSNSSAKTALLAELTNFDYAINPDAITSLGPGQALSYRLTGSLTSNVTLSWSDVISSNLSFFSSFLKRGDLLAFQASASASVSLDVAISDDFLIIFTDAGAGKTRLSVKKAKSRRFGIEGSVGVTIGFKNPEKIVAEVDKLLKGVVGEEINRVTDLINKIIADPTTLFSNLSPIEQKIIKALIERLGLQAQLDNLSSFVNAWTNIVKKVKDKVKEVVETKVKAVFSASYSRLKEETTILEVILTDQVLRENHKDLLLANISNVVDKIRAKDPSYQLIRYLHQEILETVFTLGVMISFGPLKLGGKDKISERRVTLENINKEQKISYTGAREYRSTFFGDKEAWITTIRADMEAYKKPATTCDFKYGLHLKHRWLEKKLTEKELREYLEQSLIWRTIGIDDVEKIVAEHKTRLNGEKAKVVVQIKADNITFRKLVMDIKSISEDDVALVFAKAMPWIEGFTARTNIDSRTSLYAPLWKRYFKEPNLQSRDYAIIAANHFRIMGSGLDLQQLEGERFGVDWRPLSFPWILEKDGTTNNSDVSGIKQIWDNFRSGITRLSESLVEGKCKEFSEIEKVFDKINPFWSQTFFMRACGILITNLAARGDYLKSLDRSLKIVFPDLDEDKEFIYTVSAGTLVD